MTETTTTRWTANAVGVIVPSGYGHYGTSEALLAMLRIGWTPSDAAETEALALTYQASGHIGVTYADANDARRRAGLPILADDAPEWNADDLSEALTWAMDDAESWANDTLADDGHYFGWNEGDFGYWPIPDDDQL